MRHLPRNRRVAVIAACVAAIIPSVLLLTVRPNPVLSDSAAGGIMGALIGLSFVGLVAQRSGCRRDEAPRA